MALTETDAPKSPMYYYVSGEAMENWAHNAGLDPRDLYRVTPNCRDLYGTMRYLQRCRRRDELRALRRASGRRR